MHTSDHGRNKNHSSDLYCDQNSIKALKIVVFYNYTRSAIHIYHISTDKKKCASLEVMKADLTIKNLLFILLYGKMAYDFTPHLKVYPNSVLLDTVNIDSLAVQTALLPLKFCRHTLLHCFKAHLVVPDNRQTLTRSHVEAYFLVFCDPFLFA